MKIDTTRYQSPNWDERTLPVSILVLHYTGMESGQGALERLCDADAKVSAHYVVEEDGRIFQLVDEAKRAWHAGVSSWKGESNVNSASIGIEIVNGGHDYGLPDFPDAQVNAVIALSKAIVTRHGISASNIVGHSDVAPGRKQDPGEKFPWKSLAAAGLGYWPDAVGDDERVLFEPGLRDRGVAILQRGLAQIGYKLEVSGVYDQSTMDVVTALQQRFQPQQVTGHATMQTMMVIKSILENT